MILTNKFESRSIWRKVRSVGFRARREEGSTLIEFAMVALVLFTFMIGIVYGGIMAYDRVVLTNAVAAGVRTLAAERGDPTACTDASNAISATAYGLNSSALTIVSPPLFLPATGSSTVGSSCNVTTGTGPSGAPCSTGSPCQELTVHEFAVMAATYPCNMYFPKLGINLCSISKGNTTVDYPPNQSSTSITVNCPFQYCFYSIEATEIE